MMHLMLIPESAEMAQAALSAGVDQLFLDLERAGKQARQGTGTWISTQSMEDIARYRGAFPDTHILVRTDPWSDLPPEQLEGVLAAGVQQVMLPMIRSAADVEAMCSALAGRLPLVPLIETVASAEALKQIAALDGVESVYFGLNDLHLERGDRFMFQPLADGTVERLADVAKSFRKPFGFGGMARLGHGDLDAELILAEHVRLGSTSVMLSRKFKDRASGPFDWQSEIGRIRQAVERLARRSADEAEHDRLRLVEAVDRIVQGRPTRGGQA